MRIQIITNKNTEIVSKHTVTCSSFNKPIELDAYDINIISLQDQDIWKYESDAKHHLNITNDFKSIKTMIENSNTVNIVALPQNYKHYYYKRAAGGYYHNCELKDEISNLQNNLLVELLPSYINNAFKLVYQNSETIIDKKIYKSAFNIIDSSMKVLTKSQGGEKATTVEYNEKFIITTLNLQYTDNQLDDFIRAVGLDKRKEELPQWLIDYKCFDDEQQQKVIEESNRKICELNRQIEQAEAKLDENLKYKSILSTNGNELVSVVFEILEKMLDCDLSLFSDEKREDFLIPKKDITFVGEIKGVTSNVKYEHVTQVEIHRSKYLDKLKEENRRENTKTLLIINPIRNKSLDEREPLNSEQIDLSEKFGSLIITTETLLNIFEQFQNGDLSSEKIVSVLSSEIGLLQIDAFSSNIKSEDNSVYKIR